MMGTIGYPFGGQAVRPDDELEKAVKTIINRWRKRGQVPKETHIVRLEQALKRKQAAK